jgi:hypothetical protein
MRRSSVRATEISQKACVSPRRIEGWTLNELDPIESLSFDDTILHYQSLAKLSGPGRGRNADVIALRLAAYGFACRRLRKALLQKMFIDEATESAIVFDFSTDESTDKAFEKFDEIAHRMRSLDNELPPLLRRVFEQLQRNVRSSESFVSDTADEVFHSAMVNLLYLLCGGEVYNPVAITSVFAPGESDVDQRVVDIVNDQFHINVAEIDATYRNLPLDEVVAMAKWLRERASLFVDYLNLDFVGEVELDEAAALLAPYAHYVLGNLLPLLGDTGEFVQLLDLPTQVTTRRHAF